MGVEFPLENVLKPVRSGCTAPRTCYTHAHSVVSDSVTPWTVARQAPLSMEFSRQEYWSGLLFPSPGDLPDPGIESVSPESPALAGRFFTIVPSSIMELCVLFLIGF